MTEELLACGVANVGFVVGAGIDQVRPFRAFCDGHDLARADRDVVVELLAAFLVRALPGIRARAEAGHPGFAEIWRPGYAERNLPGPLLAGGEAAAPHRLIG